MTTSTSRSSRAAAPGPPRRGEPAAAREARLARRRLLLLRSLPAVLLVLVAALKLLTMVAAGQQASSAYEDGGISSLQQAAGRMGLLNVVERHKAPFALGDAAVLVGDFDTARARFEEALTLAPTDGLEACRVRVNLVLSLERLADAARASAGDAAAAPYDDRIAQVADGAPQGCFQPEGQGTGQELQDAKDRAQSPTQPQQGQDPQPGQDPQQPSPDKQQQLDQKTKDNQAQRAQGEQGSRDSGGGSLPQVDKPW